jgi:hypothetical protein
VVLKEYYFCTRNDKEVPTQTDSLTKSKQTLKKLKKDLEKRK